MAEAVFETLTLHSYHMCKKAMSAILSFTGEMRDLDESRLASIPPGIHVQGVEGRQQRNSFGARQLPASTSPPQFPSTHPTGHPCTTSVEHALPGTASSGYRPSGC
jgi:hypothetical protein